MPWRVTVVGRARKDLDPLSEPDRAAILRSLKSLEDGFAGKDFRKLKGQTDMWRLREGRWRVIVHMDKRQSLLSVVRVLPRDEAYRR